MDRTPQQTRTAPRPLLYPFFPYLNPVRHAPAKTEKKTFKDMEKKQIGFHKFLLFFDLIFLNKTTDYTKTLHTQSYTLTDTHTHTYTYI